MEWISKVESNKSASLLDLMHPLISTYFYRETLFSEIQHVKALIEHKHNELNVYNRSKQLVEVQRHGADECLVFLGDNLFVMQKNDLAKAILQRQIQIFAEELQKLEEERKTLELKLCTFEMENCSVGTSGGSDMVDDILEEKAEIEDNWHRFCDLESGAVRLIFTEKLTVGKKRIAHLPSKKRKTEDRKATEPAKGFSKKDYGDFLNLLDKLNVRGEDSSEDSENDEEMDKGKSNNRKKRVHFTRGTVAHSAMGKKSILRNRFERSPIDSEELQRMCKRDFVEFFPTSNESLSDVVSERTNKTADRRKTKKDRRPVSAWKTRRIGMPGSDEEEIAR